MKKNRIAILIPYFGKWPPWIELYLYSCRKNKSIDWYFFTDCGDLSVDNDNVYFIETTFVAYCDAASEKLQINFQPKNPYKLCGLRPFYAFLHTDILEEYEFWGYGDIDIIWGNIASFYTDKVLDKYDVLSTHGDRLSGHLAIIRNTPKYSNLCFKIDNWKDKLHDQKAIPLDEQEFSWLIYPQSKFITLVYSKIIYKIFNWSNSWVLYNYLLQIFNALTFSRLRRIYFKEQHTTPILSHDGLTCKHDADTWYYKDGEMTNNKTSEKYIYMHFMILKKNAIRPDHYWNENYYLLNDNYDFSKGVKISKVGFEIL